MQARYCNIQCQHDFLHQEYIENWKAGRESGNSKGGRISAYIKRYLREKFNNRCSRCGWNEKHPADGTVPVEVEHIDGDWRNNAEGNLTLLCPSCHSLTSTYRGRNQVSRAGVAQLAEHSPCKRKAKGSTPFIGSTKMQDTPCKTCGTPLEYINWRVRNYCNRKCHKEYLYQAYIERWKQGLETGVIKGASAASPVKRYLREKFDNRCSRCGWNEKHPDTGEVPVEVEHLDGDWRNNKEENLTLLCPNCHSLTSTYRGRNTGKGRPRKGPGRKIH